MQVQYEQGGHSTLAKPNLSRYSVYLAKVALLAGVYFVTAKAGLSLSPVSGFATLVWPPTGIALAVLFLFGINLWPGVLIGATLVNYINGASPWVAIGIGIGNSLEAIVGAYAFKRFGLERNLDRIKDVILLVVAGALLSTLISATFGTTTLLVSNTIGLSAYARTWSAWWIGDMLGAIIATPLLLVWLSQYRLKLGLKQWGEAFALAALCLIVGAIIFEEAFLHSEILNNVPYLLFPFMIWAALRFRVRLVVTLNALLTALTVHAAIYNYGPFAGDTIDQRLLSSQLFIGVTAVTFLTFSAAMAERRQAQAVTLELNQQLKSSLLRKTTELRREKEIEKLKDEFIAVASHELKTPTTTIKAYANLLDKRLSASNDKDSSLLAVKIDSQVDKLTRLTDELMEVSRLQSGHFALNKSNLNMNVLVAKAISDFQHTAPKYQFVNECKKLPRISADKNGIEQVFLNLLANAVKYSPNTKKVIVTSKITATELIISVQDFGSGIPRKDLTKVFDRFYRISDKTKGKEAVSGIGLGLYIASQIIKQHKGRIWVKSTLGKGSTFSFALPLK